MYTGGILIQIDPRKFAFGKKGFKVLTKATFNEKQKFGLRDSVSISGSEFNALLRI